MDIKKLTAEAIQEVNQGREDRVKSNIKQLIREIISEQKAIKGHQEVLSKLQESLREIETKEEVTESILG